MDFFLPVAQVQINILIILFLSFGVGLISGLFLIFYSIFRFFVEFFRIPDEQLGYIFLNLSMGQVISLIFIFSGILLFYFKNEDKQAK